MPKGVYERKRKSILERFEEKINKDGPIQAHMDTACWEWTAGKSRQGYGKFGFGPCRGQLQGAHRVSWKLYKGPIPDGMGVLHKCHNPGCANPDHLYVGTQQQNMNDMVEANRQAKGSQYRFTKLTENEVLEIRNLYESDQFTQVELGNRFRVARRTIGHIVNRNVWTHI